MVAVYAMVDDEVTMSRYLMGIFMLLTLYALIVRPYRDPSTNTILNVGCVLFTA